MRVLRFLPALALTALLAIVGGDAHAETTKIRIGKVIGGNGFHIPSYVAWDQGYYKDEGLDASFVVLQGRPLVTAALSGNVDFVPIPSGGAQAALSGAAITYVVGESLRSQWTIVVPKSVNKIEELKGKTPP
jgi:NitT/TauT family transport system substrate-binding protein